jgi:GntR family transcriptional regulator
MDAPRGEALDRSHALPLWAQLLGELRARLAAGEFNERFPTDQELVDEYGVSRHTVREAVRRIQAEGILDRRRGRGTYVKTPSFEQPLGTLYSLYQSLETAGIEQTSVVLARDVRTDAGAAAQLDLEVDTELFYLERLRLADGEPIALDRAWIPREVAGPLLEADFAHTALYDELSTRAGVHPETGTEQIRPVLPDEEERSQLGMDPDEAAFLILRKTFAGGNPLEWRESIVRGDRYSFRVEWGGSDGATPGLVPVEETA